MAIGLVIDAKKFNKTIRKLENPKVPLERALVLATLVVEVEARKLISGPLRAVDTGELRASIRVAILRITRSIAAGEVGTDVPYAKFVHDGFRHFRSGKEIKEKPFLAKALENKIRQVVEIISKALGKHVRNSAR